MVNNYPHHSHHTHLILTFHYLVGAFVAQSLPCSKHNISGLQDRILLQATVQDLQYRLTKVEQLIDNLVKRLTALEQVSVQTTRHILTPSRFAPRLLAAPHYSTSITEAPTLSESPVSTSAPFELALGSTLSPQSPVSFVPPQPALGTSMPSHTSVPSQSPVSFVPSQPALGSSIPSQSPMSSVPTQPALGISIPSYTSVPSQSPMSSVPPQPALSSSIPPYTSLPSQSPMSFAPPQLAMGTSIPSQSPMSSILAQLALGGSASSQSSSVQPPQGTAEGKDVPPGQPLPSSAIQKERLSSVEVVLIKNSKLKGEGKAPTLAQKLAREAIFGDDVMIRCTPFGTGTLHALPVRELQYLKDIMFQQLPQYWNNTVGFEDLWKKCMEAVQQSCKRLRPK